MMLSDRQKAIVDSNEKYIYVLAGAGSGKTRVLTERVKTLLAKSGPGEKILAMTFSNRAADELNERLSEDYDLYEIQEGSYIGTIHGFCMNLVTDRSHMIGLPDDLHIFEYNDRIEILKKAMNDVLYTRPRQNKSNGKNIELKDVFDKISRAKRNFMTPSDFKNQDFFKAVYQEYNDLMLMQNAIDYDDLLLYGYRILTEVPFVAKIYREIYTNILIDEAQDLNKAQYEFIKAVAGQTGNIFMVGDPNQAIYGFNDASSKFFCECFRNDFDATEFKLNENFRSSKRVMDAADALIPGTRMEMIYPIEGDFDIISFEDEEEEAIGVVEKIKALINSGHPDIENRRVSPEQISVLGRNRYVFDKLKKELDAHSIEYNVRETMENGLGSESVLFKIFNLGLRLITNKEDVLHLRRIFDILEIDNLDIESFEDLMVSNELKLSLGQNHAGLLKESWSLLSNPDSFPFSNVLDSIERYCNIEGNFENDIERTIVHNDCIEWKSVWARYCDNTTLEIRTLPHLLRTISIGAVSAYSTGGVTLSTVHKSKGLEFDAVFIIGLNDGVFPDYRSLNDEKSILEERNNLFVSITRSKRLCYLSYPLKREKPWGVTDQQPSRFIELIQNSKEDCAIYAKYEVDEINRA